MSASRTVLVAGAGLAGALMGVYLGRRGHRVRIFERRGDPRRLAEAGRSINLAISTRGIEALAGVGLDRAVLDRAVPMRGRMIHAVDGARTFQPYGTRPDQTIHSVSRLGLNVALIEAAEREATVEVLFDQRCLDVDLDAPSMTVRDGRSGVERVAAGDVLIGADGAFSAVRARMQRTDRFDYEQSFLEYGYKELSIPAGPAHGETLERNALHIWPRGGSMMIALPNLDGTWTCTLFWPWAGETGFDAVRTPDDLRRRFEADYADAIPLMPDLAEEYFGNPSGSLVTVRCRPWHREGKVVLVGDACHAIVPFYGQGANAAFEDCLELDACLARGGRDWEGAFHDYEARRKENADALAQLAIDNFVEMRDRVSDPLFLLRKRFEKLLHRLMPESYIPLYMMVTFTRIPYAAARRRAERQWRLVRRVLGAAGVVLFAALALLLLLGFAPWP